MKIVFGPVPSRRLGRSLGINNIPPKHCTYSCVYCQTGPTTKLEVTRQAFYPSERVVGEILRALREAGERVDYITFVPSGEPTLDINLGLTAKLIKDRVNTPLAVLTNASLAWMEDVRCDLEVFDLVCVKVDSVVEGTWRRINRPHPQLKLKRVLEGVKRFAREYPGTLITETMLVKGVNDKPEELKLLADYVSKLEVKRAYIAVPTRPPAEPWVKPPTEEVLARAYAVFEERLPHVELLIGYEGDAFAASGDAAHDLLSITAVHPMREGAVEELLARDRADWRVVEELIHARKLVELEYSGHRFYMRALPSRSPRKRPEN